MVKFDPVTHTYTLDGKTLISVTQLMQKQGLAPNYDAVPADTLRAAAERGTMIHKEIEEYNKSGEIGFTKELTNFIEYIKANKVEVIESECILNNDIVAGTCDLFLAVNDKPVVADIKTTYTLHKEAVSWQLSIYAYLDWTSHQDKQLALLDYNETKGQAYHFDKDGNLNVVDIPLKPFEEVEKLMDCERKGVAYKQELQVPLTELITLAKMEELIANLEAQKKEAEAEAQEMRKELLDAMEKSGTTQWVTPFIKVTYVAPSTRTTIDSARLKKEQPAIAEQYTKITQTKASLRITIKESETNE